VRNVFSEEEMLGKINCQCGCGMQLQERTVRFLLALEEYYKKMIHKDIVVTSGARCPKHNSAVGGVANSSHTLGLAVDISFVNSHELYAIQKFAFEYGVKRIGINFTRSFIHIDFALGDTGIYPQEVVFKY
jgi:uncharacterized protein YcbK (DUF882 family)